MMHVLTVFYRHLQVDYAKRRFSLSHADFPTDIPSNLQKGIKMYDRYNGGVIWSRMDGRDFAVWIIRMGLYLQLCGRYIFFFALIPFCVVHMVIPRLIGFGNNKALKKRGVDLESRWVKIHTKGDRTVV